MAWWRRTRLELRRRWWHGRAAPGPLRDYLAQPTLDLDQDWRALEYLVLDFETTGTDPLRHEILSAGYLDIAGAAVRVASGNCLRPSRAGCWSVTTWRPR